MSIWLIIGVVAVLAAVLAAAAPRIDKDGAASLAWLAHDFGPGDSEVRAAARQAASSASLPPAALSALVTISGLLLSGGASWSGITSFGGLLLAGLSLVLGASAGRRSMRTQSSG